MGCHVRKEMNNPERRKTENTQHKYDIRGDEFGIRENYCMHGLR